MRKPNERNLTFLIAKNHVSLQLLLNGWVVQDLFFEGGPDLMAITRRGVLRVKVRYATKSEAGYIFSSGGHHERTFYELTEGCDFLIMVCIRASQAVGFYVFPHDKTPKAKTFLHPTKGPFPKYKEFFGNWKPLQWK